MAGGGIGGHVAAKYMNKPMRIMLICATILFGLIFLYKMFISFMIKREMRNQSQIETVSTMKVGYADWQPKLTASGSLRAIRGVNVTTQLAGMVQTIYFKPGASVNEGTVLVQLNADNDIALLHSLEANAELANITLNRDKAQYAISAVSKQTVDNDAANLKSLKAQVAQQAAIVAKKTIVAPFTGRLGINQVNPGQFVNPGDAIVMLQTLDPIYVDFYVPQQVIGDIKLGMEVITRSDTFPNKVFKGTITTINPAVDPATRNLEIEGTLANPKFEITPGMFVNVEVMVGKEKQYLTVPQSAVTFNPYGDIVYIVNETGKDEKGKPILTVKQAFVITGQTRGDQITILKGLKKGEIIVTSGQLKLKNGSQIEINNSVEPPNNPNPVVKDEH